MKSTLFRVIALLVVLAMIAGPVSAQVPPDPQLGQREPAIHKFQEVGATPILSRFVVQFEEASLIVEKNKTISQNSITAEDQAYLGFLAQKRAGYLAQAAGLLGRPLEVNYVYDVILNGVSVNISPAEAATLRQMPGVRRVMQVTLEQPDTDAGPTWIGAPGIWDGSATPSEVGNKGEGIIAGILDTGINFDHPSFSDEPQDAFEYTWTGDYLGVCAPAPDGNPAYASACNDKLVGAYSFTPEALTPEDADGHGSHTASTVAGNYLDVVYMGVSTTISGVAPHAQIISYDVCDVGGCYTDSSTAAVQQAILDGVSVINYSISGGKNPYTDPVELAFLEAFDAGIFVAASAGNLREEPSTDGQVNHLSPWVTTVAASSHNRKFTNVIDVVQPSGSIYVDMAQIPSSSPVPFPALDDVELKWAGDDASSSTAPFADNRQGCNAFPAGFFNGKVALIRRGVCAFADKLANAQAAGAIGLLGYADLRPPLVMGGLDTATLPAGFLYLSPTEAATFANWVSANAPVLIDMTATGRYLNDAWGDIKADFSFRGPGASNFPILKPDITAPGLEVLAGYADFVIDDDGVAQIDLLQGTSMSSPHTAGAGALIMAQHPTWTPAMVKSAIMLTAETENLIKEDMDTPADIFDFGSGRVNLELAGLTGLVMNETTANFEAADPALDGDPTALNIASLQSNACVGECSWTRTFTSVADLPAEYTVDAPAWITVTPATFTINPGATQVITINADVSGLDSDIWVFGNIDFLTDSTFAIGAPISDVHIPMAVMPTTGNLPELVKFETHRDTGGETLIDLQAVEITDLTIDKYGWVIGEKHEIQLAPDPTNTDVYDNLDQVYYTLVDMTDGAARLVAEITANTALDLDLYWGFDINGDGKPQAGEEYGYSATATAFEYLSDWGFPVPFYDVWILVQNWSGSGAPLDDITLTVGLVPYEEVAPETMTVNGPASNPAGDLFSLDILWHDLDTEEGDRLYGLVDIYADADYETNIGTMQVDVIRKADDVVKTADVNVAEPGDTITYTIEITNYADVAVDYSINDVLPVGVTYVADSVTGGAVYDAGTEAITWSGEVDAPGEPYYNVTDSLTDPLCDTGFDGYVDLESLGIKAQAAITGDTSAWTLTPGAVPYDFYGVEYPSISFTDDGFVLFDAANNYAGAPYINQDIPSPTFPNNLAAILWQDMEIVYDLTTNKGVSLASAGAGLHIIEYDDVQLWGDPTSTYDFEIVHYHLVDDAPGMYEFIFAYDNIVGPLDESTIGTENVDGSAGTQYAYNNASFSDGHMICFDLVTPSTTHTITFQVTVDDDAAFGLLINKAMHDNDALGTLVEAAKALVEIGTAPVAVDDEYTTAEDTLLTVEAPGVLSNDTDAEMDPLTAKLVIGPLNGELVMAEDGSFTYMPDLDFVGEDTFTYQAFDGIVYSEIATVTITVTPVNDAPEAVDDEYTVIEDGILEVAAPGVMENDIEVDLDNMVVSLLTNVEHGTLILLGNGSFTYKPDKGFSGIDTFEYQLITYPNGIQSEWTDEATVTITVTPLGRIYLPLIMR